MDNSTARDRKKSSKRGWNRMAKTSKKRRYTKKQKRLVIRRLRAAFVRKTNEIKASRRRRHRQHARRERRKLKSKLYANANTKAQAQYWAKEARAEGCRGVRVVKTRIGYRVYTKK